MKKKILHILHSEIGGTSDLVFSILQNKKKLYDEHLLFTGPFFNKNFLRNIIDKKINFNFLRVKKFSYFSLFLKIFYFLKKKKFNIIYIHNYQIFPVLFFKFFFNCKIIYIDHKAQNLKNFRDHLSIFLMKFFSNKIVFVNKKNFLFYKKNSNFFCKKFLYIPNAVNNFFFVKSKKKFNKKKYLIGMASRINHLKKHELIIQSLASKKLCDLKIYCYFAGDGPHIEFLKNLVNKLNLNNKVKFVGNLNTFKLKLFYQKLNLYIHASKGEAMSISILQAMSVGVPVLASDVPGINDIVQNKKFVGKLFKNNINDLCKNILYFYHLKKNNYEKYSISQKKYIMLNHNEGHIKKKYLKIIYE